MTLSQEYTLEENLKKIILFYFTKGSSNDTISNKACEHIVVMYILFIDQATYILYEI